MRITGAQIRQWAEELEKKQQQKQEEKKDEGKKNGQETLEHFHE